jgi:cellulose synthase/poly-beta-1,6-N-acetylglucosamine synthase-like glycosyltransferase
MRHLVTGDAGLAGSPRPATEAAFSSRRGSGHDLHTMTPISVVVTVRDDREGLEPLLSGLAEQSRVPDEVILVDGGSERDSLARLEEWRQQVDFPVRVVVEPGTNIAAGRNLGIGLAAHEWIAVTDAGCRPEPGWLAALHDAMQKSDIVAGVFLTDARTPLERILAVTHYPSLEEVDQPPAMVRLSHRVFGRRFEARHAGGRSMGIHRRAWQEAGGFPETQYAGEDLALSAAVIRHGFSATLAPAARVWWRPPSTWRANAVMFFTYCRGDIRSPDRSRHAIRLAAWTLGPLAMLRGGRASRFAVALGALSYLGLPAWRAWGRRVPLRHWWRIPVAVAVKDLAQLAGAARGLLDVAQGIPQPNPKPPPAEHVADGQPNLARDGD